MDPQVLEKSDAIISRTDRMNKFQSKHKGLFPHKEAKAVISEISELSAELQYHENPQTQDELIESELKRRLDGEALSLEFRVSPSHYDFETVRSMLAIPQEDISELGPWLTKNRAKTLEAVDRLYQSTQVDDFELGLPMDIPGVRRQAEEFAAVHVNKYHQRLGKLLQNKTQIGNFLRDITAVASTTDRSYFHPVTNTLAIGIPAICYTTSDGGLDIKNKELIRLYGHEGMGHALNQVMTLNSDLPGFLKRDTGMTTSTMESIAQHFEKLIFEDLKDSPDALKDLGIAHDFPRIYQEAKDSASLDEYQSKLFQYAITVLADRTLGDPQDPNSISTRIEKLNEVTLNPDFPLSFIEGNRYSFDSRGNLSAGLVSELRYCAQPVKRALSLFESAGMTYENSRDVIDSTLLTGFWTPTGYVENAKLKIKDTQKDWTG